MTEKKSGKPSRRRIQLEGQPVEGNERSARRASFTDTFKIDEPEPEDSGGVERTYHEQHLEKFLVGQMTLGDLEGVTKQQQYQIARIGYAYLTSGKLEEAKKVFEGLLALDPFDPYFHMSLASIAQQNDELEEADSRYSRALEINPFSPTAHANRGEIRVMSGRLAEGALDLVKAIQLDPDGKEPATARAKATVRVLKEQLGALDLTQLQRKANDATETKVKAAQEATKRAGPRPRPRARPNTKQGARPSSTKPKKK